MLMREYCLAAGFALAACGGNERGGRTAESAGGEAASGRQAAAVNTTGRSFAEFGTRMGKIPVLEYHVVGDSTRGQFIISREKFQRDLELLYERGYRPITVAQLVDRDFSDVPPGMSPVVFTFDDASPEQFSYIEQNGELLIDPKTVMGMWVAFNQKHPDWRNRATFCLLSGAGAGHNFFGDNPKWRGQKKEWRQQKVKWLADNGIEVCNHTVWHARLDKYPDNVVQEQIARGQMAIDSAVPGYKVRTFALPLGMWPKNRELAWKGSWTDPKTGKATAYNNETVLEVSGGPAKSPFDPAFDKTKVTRTIISGNALEQMLDHLDKSKTRFVWDGSSK